MFKLILLSFAVLANSVGAHSLADRIQKPTLATAHVEAAQTSTTIMQQLPVPQAIPVLQNSTQFKPQAEAMVLYDVSTGTKLLDINGELQRPMASTIKLLTILVAINNLPPTTVVTVSAKAAAEPGSTANLFSGDKVTAESLYYGLMMNSGNDAATAIAEAVGGTKEQFVTMMNAKAKALQLENTVAADPHGYSQVGTLSSALDITKLMAIVSKDERILKYMQPKTQTFTNVDGKNLRTLNNSSRFAQTDSRYLGGKTGTGTFGSYKEDDGKVVKGAGHVMTAAMKINGRVIIGTVAGTYSNAADASYTELKRAFDFVSSNLQTSN